MPGSFFLNKKIPLVLDKLFDNTKICALNFVCSETIFINEILSVKNHYIAYVPLITCLPFLMGGS